MFSGHQGVQYGKVWERFIQDGVAVFVAVNLGATDTDGVRFTTTDGNDRAILTSSPNHPSAILLVNASGGLQFFPALPIREKAAAERCGSASVNAGRKLWLKEATCSEARFEVADAFCGNWSNVAAAH